jgi:riboflavin kinase/FMN adenylyltransferase
MMNIGVKPTVQESGIQNIEVHLFYFSQNIYGAKVKIKLKKRIRDEQRFDSLDALKARLVEDRRQSKLILGIK